jgi:hypothetical protein
MKCSHQHSRRVLGDSAFSNLCRPKLFGSRCILGRSTGHRPKGQECSHLLGRLVLGNSAFSLSCSIGPQLSMYDYGRLQHGLQH